MNVLLMGPRASGKTSIGRLLAHHLHRTFVDLDDRVRAGFAEPTVGKIWQRHGEPAWREAELEALSKTLDEPNLVVALGGGTPMIRAARELIESKQANGLARTCYLRCSADTLTERLRRDVGDRPSLTGGDPAAEVKTILADREATYLALADCVVDATGSPGQVVEQLLRELNECGWTE